MIISLIVVASDQCLVLEEQLGYLAEREKETLWLKGFVYSDQIPDHLPAVVISREIVNSCEHRFSAEKYFVNKIRGENVFDLSEYELEAARAAIAKAAYLAINVKGVWSDGISHEIFNVVSDDLLPDWVKYQERSLEEYGVDLVYFTPTTFVEPDPSLIGALRSLCQMSHRNYEAALILFLKKNSGLAVNIEDARNALENSKSSQDIAPHVTDDEVVDMAIELLSKEGSISYDEAFEFQAALFGWV